MRLLRLFKNKKERKIEDPLPWEVLSKMEQLDEIEITSQNELVAIFKHSTRCPVSRMAYSMFQKDFNREWDDKVAVYVLDLLRYRTISEEVAARFQVWHESPQLLLIKEGKTIYHASHHAITAAQIGEFLE